MARRAAQDRNPNAGLVAEAAARLDIKEFDLFALAHRWWFGQRLEPRALERVFTAYMFAGAVPPWVRQFARETICELGSGNPDLARLGLARRRHREVLRHAGLIVTGTLAVFVLIYALLLHAALEPEQWATPPQTRTAALSCQGGGPGLRFFEALAQAIAGRDGPSCE